MQAGNNADLSNDDDLGDVGLWGAAQGLMFGSSLEAAVDGILREVYREF
jgi:lipid-binding SYLF domain-containing protein